MSCLIIEAVDMLHVQDDWNWVLHDASSGKTAIVDPSEAAGVIAFLESKNWSLDVILNTHHHWDHTDGNVQLKEHYGCEIVGAAADKPRIRGIDTALGEGESYDFAGYQFEVMEISGHTIGHIAYYCAAQKLLFTGDTLFAMGCGRMFEGTAAMYHASLQKLAALPDDTIIYPQHEYTIPNGRFARKIEPDNAAIGEHIEWARMRRRQKLPSLPTTMGREKATNPYLRTHHMQVRAALGLTRQASDVEVFAALRHAKDTSHD